LNDEFEHRNGKRETGSNKNGRCGISVHRRARRLAGIAVWIALQTDQGRTLWNFVQDAQIEVRKVVWPTRQETIQTTFLVFIVVIITALILWGLDTLLGWAIRGLIGGPGG